MRVATHKCMEAMLGISLYSYPYPILAKIVCLSYYLLCFLLKNIREEDGIESSWKWGGWGCGRGR
jgi:hypothetical protein